MPVRASPATIVGARFEDTTTTPIFRLGEQCIDSEGGIWAYVQANGVIAINDAVKVDNDGQAAALTTAISGSEPTDVGVAQVAFADNEYGWVWQGPGGGVGSGIKVNVLTLCATDVKLYTTATAGKLDDTATDLIQGLTIVATNSGGSTAAVECFASQKLSTNAQD